MHERNALFIWCLTDTSLDKQNNNKKIADILFYGALLTEIIYSIKQNVSISADLKKNLITDYPIKP